MDQQSSNDIATPAVGSGFDAGTQLCGPQGFQVCDKLDNSVDNRDEYSIDSLPDRHVPPELLTFVKTLNHLLV